MQALMVVGVATNVDRASILFGDWFTAMFANRKVLLPACFTNSVTYPLVVWCALDSLAAPRAECFHCRIPFCDGMVRNNPDAIACGRFELLSLPVRSRAGNAGSKAPVLFCAWLWLLLPRHAPRFLKIDALIFQAWPETMARPFIPRPYALFIE